MFVLLAISLFTSREILRCLGVSDFGIYNVVAGIVSFIVFFYNSLTSATQRFINYALGVKDGDVEGVFRASMVMHVILCISLIIGMETVGLWFLNNKIVLPPDRLNAAQWAFHTSVVIGVLSIIKSPYHAIIIAYERMNVFAYYSIIEALLKLLIVYVLAVGNIDALISYSVLMMIVQVIVNIMYYYYCERHFKIQIRLKGSINKQLLGEITKFIGWSSYGGVSMLGYTQGLNVLLNLFFGPVQNAARGIAVQVESVVKQFRSNFQVAVNPQLVQSYAEHNVPYFMKLMSFGCKFSTYIMLAMTVPLCYRVNWILNIWLVEVPANTDVYLKILLIASLIDSPSPPFVTGIQANGNIKYHEIINGTLLLLVLPFSYLALKFGLPSASVFVIYAVFMLITIIVRVVLFSNLLKIDIKSVYNLIFKQIFIVCAVSFLLGFVIDKVLPQGVAFSFIYCVLIFSLVILISYYIGLSVGEKDYANNIIKKLINKVNHSR